MKKKRILSVLLSLAIVLSGMPGNVFAAEDIALEDGLSDEEKVTEDVTEESTEDMGEFILESEQGVEDFTGFSDGESEDFVDEEEIEDETDPVVQLLAGEVSIIESGICGDNLTYTITGDALKYYTLTISGNGSMYNYNVNDLAPWYMRRAEIHTIVIESGVESIGDYSFVGCMEVESVIIPEGVTSIGNKTFEGCRSLTSITIPERVTRIGNNAFSGCSGLTSINVPEGVTSIEWETFEGCRSLTSITIPETVTSIGNNAFSGCSGLTSITLPKGLMSIGDDVFGGCSGLTSIALPKGLMSIGDGVFDGCSGLTSIDIPKGVTSIQWAVFSGCSGLTSITIPEGVTKIEDIAFSGCSGLTSIDIPKGVTSIGNNAFEGCRSLKIVRYAGSKEQWDKLNVSLDSISDAIVYYNCDQNHTHLYEVSIKKVATCIETGEKLLACKFCSESHIEEIPATGHSWCNWKETKAASVSEEGLQQRICSKCGKVESKNIPKLIPIQTITPTPNPVIPKTLTIKRGKFSTLKPDSSWENVKYSSSNKKVATVDKKGKVKAVAAGTVKITVKSGSKTAICIITVPGTTAIKNIKSFVSIKKGKSYTLKPKLSFARKADKVTYKSSNKKIATVSRKGVVKGKKKGTVTITIKSGKVTKKCKVKVK